VHILVVETAGYKQYMSGTMGKGKQRQSSAGKAGVDWQNFYSRYQDEDEFYGSSDCDDYGYLYSSGSSDEYNYYHHHHHHHHHGHQHSHGRDSYEKMKYRQHSSSAKQVIIYSVFVHFKSFLNLT